MLQEAMQSALSLDPLKRVLYTKDVSLLKMVFIICAILVITNIVFSLIINQIKVKQLMPYGIFLIFIFYATPIEGHINQLSVPVNLIIGPIFSVIAAISPIVLFIATPNDTRDNIMDFTFWPAILCSPYVVLIILPNVFGNIYGLLFIIIWIIALNSISITVIETAKEIVGSCYTIAVALAFIVFVLIAALDATPFLIAIKDSSVRSCFLIVIILIRIIAMLSCLLFNFYFLFRNIPHIGKLAEARFYIEKFIMKLAIILSFILTEIVLLGSGFSLSHPNATTLFEFVATSINIPLIINALSGCRIPQISTKVEILNP